jgi:hypothetical protein
VEHRLTHHFGFLLTRTAHLAVLFGLFLILTGCKEPVPNPELRDPIYGDLKAQLATTLTELEAEKKEIAELEKTMPKMDVRTAEIRQARRLLVSHTHKFSQLKQMKEYYEVRLEQRKAFVEKDYLRAFEADLPWPNPDEYERYKVVKKLRTADRNWDSRVPKLTRNLKNPPPGSGAPAKKEEKSGHGEAAAHH